MEHLTDKDRAHLVQETDKMWDAAEKAIEGRTPRFGHRPVARSATDYRAVYEPSEAELIAAGSAMPERLSFTQDELHSVLHAAMNHRQPVEDDVRPPHIAADGLRLTTKLKQHAAYYAKCGFPEIAEWLLKTVSLINEQAATIVQLQSDIAKDAK